MSRRNEATEPSATLELRKPSAALVSAALCGLFAAAASGCPSDDDPSGHVTSSRVEPDVTLESFTADCDEAGGTIEQHAHCGGMNSCTGFSYDITTQTLSEHTCRGLNTCTGYSCVVPG